MTIKKSTLKSLLIVNTEIIMQVVTCVAILAEFFALNILGIQAVYGLHPAWAVNYLGISKDLLDHLCNSTSATTLVFGVCVVIGLLLFALIKTQKEIDNKY